MKKIVKKILLVLVVLAVVLSALSRCGGSPRQTSSAAASASASSAAPAATATPAPTSEPLVEQEAYGIQFLLPKSIAATKRTSEDGTLTRYYLNGSESAAPPVMLDISVLDDLPAVETWTDSQFNAFASGLAGDEGTLLQKGEVVLNPSSPLPARYATFQRTMEDTDYDFATVYFSNLSVYMIWEAAYDNPYTDVWESMLDSIEIVESPVESAVPASGIRPEFKEMMDSYEAFFDEYIAFMAKYKKADGTAALSMLSDLSDYMAKYTDYMAKLDAVDQDDLSPEEALYYLEVSTRIMQKLSSSLQ